MRTDRHRHENLQLVVDQLPDFGVGSGGGGGFLAITVAGSSAYPTARGVVYNVSPVSISADDTAGATPDFTTDDTQILTALHFGTVAPAEGSYVVVHEVESGNVFRWDGP